MTGAGMVLGTPEYMAPELIMGEPFDGRIDQYALAVTVYEMLAGRRPFEAASPTACMVMQTTQEPPPLCAVEPRVPRALSDAVARALTKDPARPLPELRGVRRRGRVGCGGRRRSAARARRRRPRAMPSGPTRSRLDARRVRNRWSSRAALLADPEKVRGKRVTCPSCQAPSADRRRRPVAGRGLGRVVVGHPCLAADRGDPEGGRARVRRRSPWPGPPRRRRSGRRRPPPPLGNPATRRPGRASPPRNRSRSGRSRPGVGGVVLAAAVLVAVVVIVDRAVGAEAGPRPRRYDLGPAGVPRSRSTAARSAPPFGDALALAPGVHELDVTKDGFEPFSRQVPVAAGEESGFKVILTREPPPPPAPDAAARAPRRPTHPVARSPVPPPLRPAGRVR